MKIRNGFVSNSSAASFVVDTRLITMEQFKHIIWHIPSSMAIRVKENITNKHPDYFSIFSASPDDRWDIEFVDKYTIRCSTICDNFNLIDFLKYIKVPKKSIKIEYSQDDRGLWLEK